MSVDAGKISDGAHIWNCFLRVRGRHAEAEQHRLAPGDAQWRQAGKDVDCRGVLLCSHDKLNLFGLSLSPLTPLSLSFSLSHTQNTHEHTLSWHRSSKLLAFSVCVCVCVQLLLCLALFTAHKQSPPMACMRPCHHPSRAHNAHLLLLLLFLLLFLLLLPLLLPPSPLFSACDSSERVAREHTFINHSSERVKREYTLVTQHH